METETLETQQIDASTASSDKLPIASLFSAENAREMALKSWEARRQRKAAAELAPPVKPLEPHLNPLQAVIMEQIRQIDGLMEDCKPRDLVAFADAKTKLWKLLFPQPKASRSRRDFTPAEPIEPGQ